MRPFDLERALAGYPVVTRRGTPVTDFHYFKDSKKPQKLFADVDGVVFSFTETGAYWDSEHDLDLFMATVKVTQWIVLMRGSADKEWVYCDGFPTKEAALESARKSDVSWQVVKMEWEE